MLAPTVTQDAADFADPQSADDFVANLAGFIAAFPDLQHDIEQVVLDGDRVVARVFSTGTHQGEFQGIAPTGREITWTTTAIFRLECGVIAQNWVELSALNRLQQLGALPGAAEAGISTPVSEETASLAPASPVADCPTTTEEENAALVARWYDEVMTQGNFDHVAEFIAPNHKHHRRVLNWYTTGAESRIATARQWRETLPDFAVIPEFILTDWRSRRCPLDRQRHARRSVAGYRADRQCRGVDR